MASFYADEDFDYPVVVELRQLGHDVLTVQEAGQKGQKIRSCLHLPAPRDEPFLPTTGGTSFVCIARPPPTAEL